MASFSFFLARSSADKPDLSRTVTLWIGMATTLLTVCVAISAVALMPGRRGYCLSETRIFTMKLVTSSETVPEEAVPLPDAPALSAEAPISRTTPLNLRSGYASIAIVTGSPTFTFTMSFSLTFTRTSILLRSATRMISVPANSEDDWTRSPTSEERELMVPSMGE